MYDSAPVNEWWSTLGGWTCQSAIIPWQCEVPISTLSNAWLPMNSGCNICVPWEGRMCRGGTSIFMCPMYKWAVLQREPALSQQVLLCPHRSGLGQGVSRKGSRGGRAPSPHTISRSVASNHLGALTDTVITLCSSVPSLHPQRKIHHAFAATF